MVKINTESLKDYLVTHRRYLHQNPEIQFELPKTTKYVISELKKLGYSPVEICHSGIIAEIGKETGKTVLVRGDMDALGVEEKTDLPYKSTNNYMHACGHDMHTAMLLGVAKVLKENEDELEGRVRLMFQPAEEIIAGAKRMIDANVLENVDVAFAAHVFSENPSGHITLPLKACCASSDIFRIDIEGVGCHGAMPNTGIDPLNVACHTILNIQTLNSRENDPLQPLVVTVGKLDGAYTCNIIPNKITLEGTIRTFDSSVRSMAKKRLKEIVSQTAVLFNAKGSVEFLQGTPPLVIDDNLAEEVSKYAKEVLEEGTFSVKNIKLMGSEDFSYVAEQVPSVFFMVNAGVGETPYPQHHPSVQFDENVMPLNVNLMTHCVLSWLKNNK